MASKDPCADEAEQHDEQTYRWASTVKQTMYDPCNDIEAGEIYIVEGRCEDGVLRTVIDESTEGFVDIEGEVIERFEADTPMTASDIRSWAARKANESEVDYSNV